MTSAPTTAIEAGTWGAIDREASPEVAASGEAAADVKRQGASLKASAAPDCARL